MAEELVAVDAEALGQLLQALEEPVPVAIA